MQAHLQEIALHVAADAHARQLAVFASYDDILAHCWEGWNKLVDQPWLIMSIGLHDWVYEF